MQISGVLETIGVRKERWRDDGLRRPGARGKVQRDCFTLKTLDNFSMEKVVERPAPSIFTDTKVSALALLQIGASQALDCDADRCLRCVMRASQGSIVAGAIAKLVLTLHSWAR